MKPQNVVVLSRSDFGPRLWKHKIKMASFFPLLCAVLLFAVAWTVSCDHTLAYYIFASNATGNDISYPQCSTSDYPQNAFGVVGVTGGRAFTANPCLSKEFAWAGTLSHPSSLYMNLNAPVGPTASKVMTNDCVPEDKLCQAVDYGYNAAQYAFDYAASQNVSSPMWWLDIETANSWLSDISVNQAAIDGAAQFFIDHGGITVGIYSTPNMWRSITGNYKNGLPVWRPAGSMPPATYCSSKYSFTGGTVYLVQYISNGFDANYAC